MKNIFIFILFFSVSLFSSSKDEVRNSIREILTKIPSTSTYGIIVYNPISRDTIFQYNPYKVMIPASNNKLYTTSAALDLLGANFQLSTKILISNSNYKKGVVKGNLYIKGYGNSLFTTADLDAFVETLKSKGITTITGSIIGDDSYFDNVYYRTDWIPDEQTKDKLPPVSALVIDRNTTAVTKKVKRRMVSLAEEITNPPQYIAELLRQKLISKGISCGNAEIGVTPANAYVICESSIALKNLIAVINKKSDNFLAECLFKVLGAEYSRKQGNSFYSTQAILKFLENNNIYSRGAAVVDGSGLSRFNQSAPASLVGILEKMYFDIANFDVFYNSLSIGGVDGTLKHRFIGTTAFNNFRGKTGTLNGVSSISGYVRTLSGEDLIVSMIFEFNTIYPTVQKEVQTDIITTLSDWKR